MRTAIFLLLLLAVASAIGTVIPQNSHPEAYRPIILALKLDDVYHSVWYSVLLILIGINLTACSINRFSATWRRTFRPNVTATAKQLSGMQASIELTSGGSAEEVSNKLETALRSSSYHVIKESDSEGVAIHAVRGRLSIWGPYLTHLSLLLVFIGAIVGSRLGFEGFVRIHEGEYAESFLISKTQEERDLGFRLALEEFTLEQDEHGNPTGYKSDLRVFEGEDEVAAKVIDVNHPLTHRKISFYQSTYGHSFEVRVTAPNGETGHALYSLRRQVGSGGQSYIIPEDPFREIRLGGEKLTVFLHNLAEGESGIEAQIMINDRFPEYKGLDAWKNLGWVGANDFAEYKDYRVTTDVVEWTGLQVGRNPGLPIVYTGFGLMLLGVFVSFYVSHRTVRVRVSSEEKGSTAIIGAFSRSGPEVFEKDLDRMREAVN